MMSEKPNTESPYLELRNICKSYGDLKANDGINLNIRRGEIHALLGENGAGKSTLVKILYGYVHQDIGEIFMNGEKIKIASPAHARKMGIGMIFQHFSLFETLTATENISLVLEDQKDLKAVADKIVEISKKYNFDIHPDKPIINLSVGERQRIEIIRCLMQNPKLLIMDEPTSVLTPQECVDLFKTLKVLAKEGRAILYISHKLEEIQEICDKATIIRLGKHVGECDPKKEDKKNLAELMIGKKLNHVKKDSEHDKSKEILKINRLSFSSKNPFEQNLKDINFTVNAGEVLGIAGIAGNGQAQLCSLLSGEIPADSADMIQVQNKPIGKMNITKRRKLGISFIPEERLGRGAVPEMSLTENTLLSNYYRKEACKSGFIEFNHIKNEADEIIQQFDVRTQGKEAEAGSLSGGNLQKFIVGREIRQNPKVMIVATPTWGIDASAEVFVRQSLLDIAKTGSAIILLSQDLDEILELSDRVAVICEGKLSQTFAVKDINFEQIGLLMGGVNEKQKQNMGV